MTNTIANRITTIQHLGDAATASDLPLYVAALESLLESDETVISYDIVIAGETVNECIEVNSGDALEKLVRHGEMAYQTMGPATDA